MCEGNSSVNNLMFACLFLSQIDLIYKHETQYACENVFTKKITCYNFN